MKARSLALADFCEVRAGGKLGLTGANFIEDGVPAYGAGGINGQVAAVEYHGPGIVLSSIGARCGKCFYADGEWTTLANTQIILPDTFVADPKYLWYQLNDERSWHRSGTAQPFIKPADVRSRRVRLPPIEEQRRIAGILESAEKLQANSRQMAGHLDALIRSIFLDMFGEPVQNGRGWDRQPLSAILSSIDSGVSPVCQDRPATSDEWAVLKLGAVTRCVYLPGENKALMPLTTPHTRYEVKPGDILFSRKNTRELVAACALVRETPPRRLLPDLIFRLNLRVGAPVERTYLHQLLVLPTKRKEMQTLAGGSAGSMPNISKARLLTADVELPPIALQKEFAKRVAAIQRYGLSISTALVTSKELFASLQHRAFAGEL